MLPMPSHSDLSPPNGRAGFSLVEVLAALVATMLLVLAFVPFASQMLATWSLGSEVANLVDLKMRGLGRMRKDLHHAIVWTGYGETDKLATFRGTQTSMSFPAVTRGAAGGIEMLSITVDSSNNGRALVRRRAALSGASYGPFQDPVVLFSGPFRFVFWYVTRDGRELSVWQNQADLPAQIRLSILDQRGSVFASSLLLPVIASISAGCLAAANLPGCPAQATQAPLEGYGPEASFFSQP
jgi:hypothetical protein